MIPTRRSMSAEEGKSLNGLESILEEGYCMAFSPTEGPVYGGGTIRATFSGGTPLPRNALYFVVFEGSTQRHVTTAKLVNKNTLQARIPEHNAAEMSRLSTVLVQGNTRKHLASGNFIYQHDSICHFAQYLIASIHDPAALDDLQQIRGPDFNLATQDLATLDDRLTSAFRCAKLPLNWHMLGEHSSMDDPPPRQTLLHFAARLGLLKLANYMRDLPGGYDSLHLPNARGELPVQVAARFGNGALISTLVGASHKSEQDGTFGCKPHKLKPATVTHRHGDAMATVTSDTTHPLTTLEADVELLTDMASEIQHRPAGQRHKDLLRQRAMSDSIIKEETDSDEDLVERPFDTEGDGGASRPSSGRFRKHIGPSNRWHSSYRKRKRSRPANKTDKVRKSNTTDEDRVTKNAPVSHSNTYGSDIPDVLEDSLQQLHRINEGIHQLRETGSRHSPPGDARKKSLQRYSSSCPSLAEDVYQFESVSTNQDSGHHKSMLDLARRESKDGLQVPDPERPSSQLGDADVRICINDVTMDCSEDFASAHESLDPELLIENLKKQKRRSSWCPEEGRKKEEKQEKQRMLAVSGRSQSLSSLDGEEESDSEEEEDEEDDDEEEDDKDSTSSYSDPPRMPRQQTPHSITTRNTLCVYEDGDDASFTTYAITSDGAVRRGMYSTGVQTAEESGTKLSIPSLSLTVPSREASPDPAAETSTTLTPSATKNKRTQQVLVIDGLPTMSPLGAADGVDLTPDSTTSLPVAQLSSRNASTVSPQVNQVTGSDNTRRILEDAPELSQSTSPLQSHHVTIQQLIAEHDAQLARNAAVENSRQDSHISIEEFLKDPQCTPSFTPDKQKSKRDVKEEKQKRRTSVFSKFGSVRQKKPLKDSRVIQSTHSFVTVSFSNSTACHVCCKSMANKAALQCENCLVNVHENSCKDQIARCARYKQSKLENRESASNRSKSSSLPEGSTGISSLKVSQSFKETKRAFSVPARTVLQGSQSTSALPRSVSPGKVLNEERAKEKDGEKEYDHVHLGDGTNISDSMSLSMESLDEGLTEIQEFDDDPELMLWADEPEAWSVTVDKKTLKKMSAKDIKRQDHIWELIQTEKSHCRNLILMQKIFYQGMQRELNMNVDLINRILPRLEDLLDIHMTFLRRMVKQQYFRPDKSIENVGVLLVEQFDTEMGERMKQAYGEFCSRHKEAVQMYKDILKTDKKFYSFIQKCSRMHICKRKGIPECILLVTQRMTKYPILIECIIKATKENKRDREYLTHALTHSREILNYIDAQVDAKEKAERLLEIYNKLEARATATYKGKKFRKSELLSNGRKLLHEGTIGFVSARNNNKPFEVLAVILTDLIFFLWDKDRKIVEWDREKKGAEKWDKKPDKESGQVRYTFAQVDGKPSVVALSNLLVREKGDTRDSKGIYLICQSRNEAEMYEIVCKTADERKQWIHITRKAIAQCPEEAVLRGSSEKEDGIAQLQESRYTEMKPLVDKLYEQDRVLRQCCDEKTKIMLEMAEVWEVRSNLKPAYKDEDGRPTAEELVHAIGKEASKLTSLLQLNSDTLPFPLAGAGDQDTEVTPTPPLPKRADTFSGFEGRDKSTVKKRHSMSFNESDSRSGSLLSMHQQCDADPNHSPDQIAAPKYLARRGSVGVPSMIQEAGRLANKDKLTRRVSTSFLHGFLSKQPAEGTIVETPGEKDKNMDPASPQLGAFPLPLSPIASVREQSASLTMLMQYIQELACVAAQQNTEIKRIQSELEDGRNQAQKMNTEMEKLVHDKKHYHHDKQLEELRNLQEAVNHERGNIEKERDKIQKTWEQDREDHRNAEKAIQKQKQEIEAEREELQRQRDVLQKQIDLFEEQKTQLQKSMQESARQKQASPYRETSSPVNMVRVPAVAVRTESISHKRSASDDLLSLAPREPREPRRENSSASIHSVSGIESGRVQKPRPQSAKSASSSPDATNSVLAASVRKEREIPLPIHLISATNEHKLGAVTSQQPQQLPLKLAAGSAASKQSSSSSSSSSSTSSKPAAAVPQLLPYRLVSHSTASTVSNGGAQTSSSLKGLHKLGSQSPSNSPGMSPKGVSASASIRDAGPSASSIHRLHSSMSQPSLSHSKQSPGMSATNMLPMKLAEKSRSSSKSSSFSSQGSKSAAPSNGNSSISAQPESQRNLTHSPASARRPKNEPEIIYF